MQQQFKKINNIAGWLVFLFATVVYAMTMESSGSFWDCGEFVPGCWKQEVVHSPGAPFFLMLGRIFTLFAFGDVTKVAFMVNFMSAVSTAASIMFCYWSVTMLAGKLVFKNKETDYTTGNILQVVFSGLIAAGCATFLDSLWFSAVEGEVYALSQFFLAFIIWAILKWEASEDKNADRWLVLIAYMTGLSIGVHLLSLLAIPFICVVYYHKSAKKVNLVGQAAAFFVGFAILGFYMKFIISHTQSYLAGFDKFFVNTLSLPFNSGVVVALVLFASVLVSALRYTHTGKDRDFTIAMALAVAYVIFGFIVSDSWISTVPRLVFIVGLLAAQKYSLRYYNIFILCVSFSFIGYFSYALVPIRASANLPINMGKPTDPFTIKSYVDREQYGDRPLAYGPDYTATSADITRVKEVGDKYYKGKTNYVFADHKIDYEFRDEACMLFPRLGFWQEESKHAGYRSWLNPSFKLIDRKSDQVVQIFDPGQEQQARQTAQQRNVDEPGRYIVKDDISMKDNIWYFLKYQVGYMYFRYFMWNFAGRQNDTQGTYGNDDGRWISGISAIDNSGKFFTPEWPQEHLSKSMLNNKGRNKFFMIPFLLGLIGLIYTLYKNERTFVVIAVLFVVTGLFQIVYQNEPPIEPRERDYAIAGSFWTYCFWIGFGVFAIIDFLKNKISAVPAAAGTFVLCLSAPFLMGSQGWDDHTRHERYTARDLAIDYLESCAPNAILLTQGDNDTYPLWYAQEVEGVRTDVRVINLSLLGVDWYIQQLKYRWNKSAPVKTTFTDEQIQASNRDVVRYAAAPGVPENASLDLKKVLQFIASEDPQNKVSYGQDGKMENFLPTKNFYLDMDTNKVKAMNMVAPEDYGKVLPRMAWSIGSGTLLKNDLLTLDIVANNIMERPIYFAVSVAPDAYVGLEKFFQLEGMTYRIVPIESNGGAQRSPVRTDVTYTNMVQKFKFGGIKENKDIYLDENIMRMTMNLRGNYARLASALLEKGDKAKAAEALDKSLTELPSDRVPLSIFCVSYPEIYYQAGQAAKAKKLSDELWAKAKDELGYFQFVYKHLLDQASSSGDRSYLSQLQQGAFMQTRAIQEQLYMMQELVNTAKKYETPEAAEKMEKDFKDTQMSFVTMPVKQ